MRLLFAMVLCLPLRAADALVDRAFSHFYNLEYDEALALLDQALAANPKDAALHNHLAQALLFREMYTGGVLESELVSGNSLLRRPKLQTSAEGDRRFHDEIRRAMELANAALQVDAKNTKALYALGIAYGLRSNYNFLVRRAWMDALRDATQGRRLHNRVTEIDPANVDARLMQGMHDYVVGSLPWFYKIAGFLVGFRGDRAQGIRTLQRVAREGRNTRTDAAIILAVLYRREKRYRDALEIIDDLARHFPRNHLLWFERAQMFSALGDKRNALDSVMHVAERKRRGEPGFARVPWEKIYYQAGAIQFWYNDLDEALANFRKVAAAEKELDLNTKVLTWMRIGQICDLTSRRREAVEAYRKAISVAPAGEAAREANRYLASPYRREKS
jgi:tetratricopeptide (TPR) repeat protein